MQSSPTSPCATSVHYNNSINVLYHIYGPYDPTISLTIDDFAHAPSTEAT